MQIECANCFKNLGVKSRVEIYEFLREKGPKNVSEITSFINLTQPTVSYHLKEMVGSGLVNRKQNGREVIYSVNPSCPHSSRTCVVS